MNSTSKWVMYNEVTRKMEEIDIEVAELLPGQTLTQLFWSGSLEKYVTVPGASLHKVQPNGDVTLDNS